MRPRYHTSGKSWAVNLSGAAPVAAPVQTFALELPIEQRAAFMLMRKIKDGAHSAAAEVMKRLDADKVVFLNHAVFSELRREGYVTQEATDHRLTPKGHHASNDILKDLCFRYSIHVFAWSGGRGSAGGTWSRCSCGTWHTGPHNNDRYGESRIRTAQTAHIRDVEQGQWPTRTLTDFLNKVDPLRFDFAASAAPSNDDGTNGRPEHQPLLNQLNAEDLKHVPR